ncbi:MAG: lysophospholipid acyltransferase family protein [Acidihalobacter sp.]
MPTARRIYRITLLLLHAALGVMLTLLMTRPGQAAPGPVFDAIVCWWRSRVAHILRLDLRVRGRPVDGPALLVANHISWMDIPVLGWIPTISFLSKAEVRGWPVIGWLAARGGTLFIRRGERKGADAAAEQITWHLVRGRKVLLCPEGTTTDGSGVRAFHPRLFAAALLAGVPVQPIALRYTQPQGQAPGTPHPCAPFIGDDTFPSHLWRVLGERRIVVEVEFLAPLNTHGRERKALAQAAQQQIGGVLGGDTANGHEGAVS